MKRLAACRCPTAIAPAARKNAASALARSGEDAEIYLNGVLAAALKGYSTNSKDIPIEPAVAATLKPGPLTVAVHGRQTGGGQMSAYRRSTAGRCVWRNAMATRAAVVLVWAIARAAASDRGPLPPHLAPDVGDASAWPYLLGRHDDTGTRLADDLAALAGCGCCGKRPRARVSPRRPSPAGVWCWRTASAMRPYWIASMRPTASAFGGRHGRPRTSIAMATTERAQRRPVIVDGRVFALGADGVLEAVDLADGRRTWMVDLHVRLGARRNFFGAGATPLVESGRVIVNVGSPGHASRLSSHRTAAWYGQRGRGGAEDMLRRSPRRSTVDVACFVSREAKAIRPMPRRQRWSVTWP